MFFSYFIIIFQLHEKLMFLQWHCDVLKILQKVEFCPILKLQYTETEELRRTKTLFSTGSLALSHTADSFGRGRSIAWMNGQFDRLEVCLTTRSRRQQLTVHHW